MPSDDLKDVDEYFDVSLAPEEKGALPICLVDLLLDLVPYLGLDQPQQQFLVIDGTFGNDETFNGLLILSSLKAISQAFRYRADYQPQMLAGHLVDIRIQVPDALQTALSGRGAESHHRASELLYLSKADIFELKQAHLFDVGNSLAYSQHVLYISKLDVESRYSHRLVNQRLQSLHLLS